jgi:hypothetical protein
MGLKEYNVEVNGYKTTLQLSDADAKAMGLTADESAPPTKVAKAPANKARTPRNKQA